MLFWPFPHRDPSFLEATKREQRRAVERLIAMGTFRSGYYMLLLLAALIVTPGLLLDNTAVIIGGMILAPVMVPILSLSLSVVSGSLRGCMRSLKVLTFSMMIPFCAAVLITLILARTYNVVTWIPDRVSPGIYIFIAFCSGIAGTLAWVKEHLAESIAGVAVAVALLPPLCAAGIAVALGQYTLLQNSLVLFVANLIGISLASFLVFLLLGFLSAGKVEIKAIDEHS